MQPLVINWYELVIILGVYTVVLFVLIRWSYYAKLIKRTLAKSNFNSLTLLTVLSGVIIVYKDSIGKVLQNPPPYVWIFSISLIIITRSLTNYEKKLEDSKVFTKEQYSLLNTSIDNIKKSVELDFKTFQSDIEDKIIPKALQDNNKEIKEIVAQTVKDTLIAVKKDPTILGL